MNIKIYKIIFYIKYFFILLPFKFKILIWLIRNFIKLFYNKLRLKSILKNQLCQKRRLDRIWDMMPFMKNKFSNKDIKELRILEKSMNKIDISIKKSEKDLISCEKSLKKMVKYLFYFPK